MSVPDADWAKARRYWLDARYADDVDGPEDVIAQVIADTRAAEREAALAPVQRLIETAPVMWHGDYPVKAVPVSDLLSALALAAAAQPTDGRTGE